MKNLLVYVFLLTFLFIGLVDQSWAFGRRGKGGGGQGGSSSFSEGNRFTHNNNGNGGGQSSQNDQNNSSEEDQNSSNEGDQGTNPKYFDAVNLGNTDNQKSSVVPEPMTMSLLGMGLAGMLLRRKKQ